MNLNEKLLEFSGRHEKNSYCQHLKNMSDREYV